LLSWLYPCGATPGAVRGYTRDMHKTMRHILTGSGTVISFAVLGAFLIVYGRSGATAPQPAAGVVAQVVPVAAVPFTEVAHGLKSEVMERNNYVITSSGELASLWKLIDATGTPPEIDFKKNAVIAIFAGEQPTTGYAISVAKVEDAGARIVSITLTMPDRNCATGQSLTTPYDIVAVPATSLPFAHKDIPTTKGCP